MNKSFINKREVTKTDTGLGDNLGRKGNWGHLIDYLSS